MTTLMHNIKYTEPEVSLFWALQKSFPNKYATVLKTQSAIFMQATAQKALPATYKTRGKGFFLGTGNGNYNTNISCFQVLSRARVIIASKNRNIRKKAPETRRKNSGLFARTD